jgi:EpsI family protein
MNPRSKYLIVGGVFILALQALASYGFHREPFLPSPPPLVTLPPQLGDWTRTQDGSIEPETLEALGPDDSLVRDYQLASRSQQASLFVAYYRTQLRGKNAHDPKVCLPGAGWNPVASAVMQIPSRGRQRAFPVNYYRIAREGAEAVVLYWFQTYNGVYTYEQQLRAHRVLDSLLANRTDMALVRIVIPVDASGVLAADTSATQLAQLVYAEMLAYFPMKENAGL